MAFPEPSRPSRLTALLGPPRPRRPDSAEPPTVPLAWSEVITGAAAKPAAAPVARGAGRPERLRPERGRPELDRSEPGRSELGRSELGPSRPRPPALGLPEPDAPGLEPPELGPPELGPPELGPPELGPPELRLPGLGPPELGLPGLGPREPGPMEPGWSGRGSSEPGPPELRWPGGRWPTRLEPGPATGPVRRARGLVAALARMWPDRWRRARVDPGRPGALALVLALLAAALLAGWGVWTQRPQAQPIGGLPSVSVRTEPAVAGTPASAPATDGAPAGPGVAQPSADTAPAAPATTLVVSVSGKVRRPGLVHLPAGSRVADAVAAAGGPLPGADLGTVNLARRVGDGEQVAIGVPAAPDAAPAPTAAAAGGGEPGRTGGVAPPGRLDLNMATAGQLDGLPGVGPVTAARIVDWRTRNGRFARVEQLREIEGIGERRFAQLRELVTV